MGWGVGGVHDIGWYETEPPFQLEKYKMWEKDERLNTELLRHFIDTWEWCHDAEGAPPPSIAVSFSLSRTHISASTFIVVECV